MYAKLAQSQAHNQADTNKRKSGEGSSAPLKSERLGDYIWRICMDHFPETLTHGPHSEHSVRELLWGRWRLWGIIKIKIISHI